MHFRLQLLSNSRGGQHLCAAGPKLQKRNAKPTQSEGFWESLTSIMGQPVHCIQKSDPSAKRKKLKMSPLGERALPNVR
jgi:hypothetical protein